ncbi:Uncharacterised protein [Escherichia coli]|uniref:Uncharacterized protein n=1 Tax=Escherichia coli TaxID=562 RepID=A0A377CYL4_ECOLX|nr:Uncharacterised protein [Escherichia coli]
MWPPDGLLQQSASPSRGLPPQPAVHGNTAALARAVAICVPLSCASASATSLRAAVTSPAVADTAPEAILPKYRATPTANQRPRGCCHIINITGNTVQHAGERFCHPAGLIRATHPGHKGVFHLCDTTGNRFRHGRIFITQYPQLAD